MIYLILILGLILRLVVINQSLWLDEAIGALVVRDLSVKEIFTSFLPVDNHPPLYYLMLKLWTAVFGYTELSIRFPSVIFGVGTIFIIYLIASRILNNRKLGIVISLLLATSQFHIYYSQEARMYSMAAFFTVLSIFCFMKLIAKYDKPVYWIIFSMAVTMMIATDYMPLFLIPVFFIYAVFKNRERKWWFKLFMSFLPVFILGFIWLPVLEKQASGGAWLLKTVPTWKSVAGGANIKQLVLVWTKFTLGRISLTNRIYYYLIVIVSSIPFAFIFLKSIKSLKKNLLIFLWLMLPLAVSFFVSYLFPVFIYFRFLYVIPAFYMAAGLGISEYKNKTSVLLFLAILLINFGSWLYYITNPHQQREQWREAVKYVESKIAPNEITLFSYPEPFAPYRWYSKHAEISYGATESIYTKEASEVKNSVLRNISGVYYFEYLKDISDPNSLVLSSIIQNGFKEQDKIGQFSGIGYIYHLTK